MSRTVGFRAWLVFVWAFCSGSTTSRALAAEPGEPTRVVYAADDAGPDCPTATQFTAAVRDRLRRGRLTDTDGTAREYRVRVRRVGERYAARLDFTEPGGAARAREVAAEGCADAASAMALVTALAIDAAGADSDGSGAADSEGLLSASEALGLVNPNVPAPPPPAAVDTGHRETTPRLAGVEQRAPAGPPPPPVEGDLGVRATLSSPKAPAVLPGAELFVGIRAPDDLWHLELGIAGERGARISSGPGSARFSFVGARLHGCVFSWHVGGPFELTPCAVFEAGALVAEGFIQNSKTPVDAWVAAGPVGRLSCHLGSGSFHAEAGPTFPITRNHFVFGQGETIHDVPAWGVYAALGGSLRIF